MEIYLMQHGPCLPKEVDPEQPLSPVGLDMVAKSAAGMRRMGISLSAICASTKRRSIQTAEIVAEKLGYTKGSVQSSELFKPMAGAEKTCELLEDFGKDDKVLVAGHLPNLAEVAAWLMGRGPIHVAIENCGLTRLDTDAPSLRCAVLRYHLTAKQLAMIAKS